MRIPSIIWIMLGVAVVGWIIDKVYKSYKENNQSNRNNGNYKYSNPYSTQVEEYIPRSLDHSAFKCPSCGAAVPGKTDDHMTMFCPFCGSPLKDSHKVIDDARQDRREEREYTVQMRQLDEQKRKQEYEQEQFRLRQEAMKRETRKNIIVVAAFFLFVLFIFYKAGMFK